MVRDGARVRRYSTMFDDTAEMPFGLGCGGVVDLLLEPAQTPECQAFLAAMEASLSGTESLVATWLPQDGKDLARAVVRDGEVVFTSDGLDAAEIALVSVTDNCLSSGLLEERIYVEKMRAPQRLFVLGAGDDAKPVVAMAALLGWNVTVADGRPQLARSERFPEAQRVLTASSVEDLGIKCGDAVVLMTHSYEQDRALLAGLLKVDSAAGTRPGYIGLLGARHRSSLLVSEAATMLGRGVAECCERIYSPVGLDLGGDGAEAIALAVVAEVQAWVQGRLGRSRRLTAEDVAEQVAQGGASRYLQTQCALGAAGS
jgi:xanthine/CO dehydrogenase XdhC/CoxF family maturation factor